VFSWQLSTHFTLAA